MPEFTHDLEELVCHFKSQKAQLTLHLERNYRENIHYTKSPLKIVNETKKQNGGQNKIVYMLTEDAFELFKNSFNFRNKYIVAASEQVQIVRFPMCIEGQTIGFIEIRIVAYVPCRVSSELVRILPICVLRTF